MSICHVLGTVLIALRVLTHLILTVTQLILLQMRTLGQGKVKELVPGHLASKW